MNRNQHSWADALTGVVTYLISQKKSNQQPNLWDGIISALCGAAGGRIPDILEPPTSPQHRGKHHSVLKGLGLTQEILRIQASPFLSEEEKLKEISFKVGHLSHLLLDSTTPAGLPLTR